MNNYNAYPFSRWIKWAAAALLILVLLVGGVSSYNGLVSAEQDVQSEWSQVENRMQERADKITNLVEVVKGYVKHEEKVFGDIAAARSVLINGDDVKSKLEANDSMTNATNKMLLLVENYPDLEASQQFHDLHVAIDESENKVAVARKRFIDSVQKYNLNVKRFPGNIFAGAMGYGEKEYFEASPDAQQSPKVKF